MNAAWQRIFPLLTVPLAIILPPAVAWALIIGAATFARWIYRGFFPAV